MSSHISVLLEESLEWLALSPGDAVVDGTVGFGGHAARILERVGPEGRLIGFDRDPQALAEAKKTLERFGEQAMLIHDNFKNIAEKLRGAGASQVNGILLDLGTSSMQLDSAGRGFSFKSDGPLDMRMDPEESLTAETIVNTYPEKTLRDLLWTLGEERFSGRISKRIEETRSRRRIRTTSELSSIVVSALPASHRHGRIHAATRTFQALRIAVNREIESLEEFLAAAPDCLAPGGRLVVISFHSLEDRPVKRAFKRYQSEGLGAVLTKKPIGASESEIASNPRSRSAKMRVFEKNSGRQP